MQIKDKEGKDNRESEDDIFQKNKKTNFGATFIAIVIVIVIALIAMTGVYLDYW